MGACHIIGRLLTAIERNSGRTFTPEQRQFYRLAALLHDVGHYPFSHAMEKAVNNFYKGKAYLQLKKEDAQGGADPIPEDSPASFDHEGLGRQIIRCDPELIQILGRHNIDPEKVRSVFSSESPEWIVSLVSSDLDCDRLDYLMRTSHHAGLPYGSVDIEYIISQASLDDEGRLALTNKALRATDHLLISRYFDYLQVAFNKSVVALEWVLEDLITELLTGGKIDCSAESMLGYIRNSFWYNFDDGFIMGEFQALQKELSAMDDDSPTVRKLNSVIFRRPPKLLVACEKIKDREHKQVHRISQQCTI